MSGYKSIKFLSEFRGYLRSVIFGFLAKTFKISQKHHPEKTLKILFIHIIDIEP